MRLAYNLVSWGVLFNCLADKHLIFTLLTYAMYLLALLFIFI